MNKISNTIDRTTFAALAEQVMAIHAEQLVAGHSEGVTHIGKVVQAIDMMLKAK
ncbi:hypothetical protein A1F94_007743 [Pyrenophora tritici-repentis]|nr:hypothetical protein A1F94_007743 [Pyrenophora tritici-repentis]